MPSAKDGANTEDDSTTTKKSMLPTALMVGGAVVAAPCVALSLFGFGAAGIVGGSLAAATQASIGNVVAGSTFAMLQGAGATGMFVNGMTAGAVAATAGAAAKVVNDGKEQDEDNESENPENRTQCPHICPDCGADMSNAQ